MRVDRIRFVRVPLVLVNPLRTATGDHSSRTATLVELTLGDGTIGWGENVAPEGDFYTGETAAASLEAMRERLAPVLAAAEHLDPADLRPSWWGVEGWPMAKHALESALWDAWCRRTGAPLAEALGGSPGTDRTVRVGAVVGTGASIDETVSECAVRAREGYTSLKLKIAPGRDLDAVCAVREAVGAGVEIHADANGSYTAEDLDRVARVCEAGLSLIEQPFSRGDLDSHVRLVAATPTAVGLDESIMTMDDLVAAIDAGALTACNVKPSRVGGLGAAVDMLETCASHGVGAWIGGMLESAVGRAGALALATHRACTLPADLSASNRYFLHDVAGPFVLRDGRLQVPPGPGLGLEPSQEALSDPATTIETVFER